MTRKFEYVKDVEHDFPLPTRGSKYSAGYDFALREDVRVKAHSYSKTVLSGVKAKMGSDEFLMIVVRSSIGFKKHLMLVNTLGVIDSDYYSNKDNDGNIGFAFYNYGDKDIVLKKGERVAQGIFVKYQKIKDDDVGNTRIGGIGSTNKI